MPPRDVASPIDLRDPVQARAWVEDTVARRPWRPEFFRAFCVALRAHFSAPVRIVELGSGPGHLAAEIIRNCAVQSYFAVDFSDAMHELARGHLGEVASRTRFVTADFRDPDWASALGTVDAVVTMQAAHELRHKSRLPLLLAQVFALLPPGGLFLYGDHYAEAGSAKNAELYLTRDGQRQALGSAGFVDIICLRDLGGVALLAATRPAG
jgi:SAM-dependent methyltransferase